MAFGNLGLGTEESFEEHEEIVEMNFIPLIDVMLVLLITFMIAAPLSIRGIDVNLPSSKAKGKDVDGKKIILSIDKQGKFFLDKLELEDKKLMKHLTAVYAAKAQKDLFIRADKDVPYGKVVDAMSAAKEAGVDKIGMLTKPTFGK